MTHKNKISTLSNKARRELKEAEKMPLSEYIDHEEVKKLLKINPKK